MPDNQSRGMIETFLRFLVPTASADLWSYALEAMLAARSRGATWRDGHADKAAMHTWLAWQDPPGQSFGNALLTKCLDPNSKLAAAFVQWFRRLYNV